ncbi:NAD(P)-dependent oxidoreductase [Nocardiopsis alba]|uniref:NAD(P)-dependent oxidoreductase n=1 Tax=Nocardiopsis TaxID=2013 RepID=UPI002DBC0A51|nr:NAD(P)-dependent oxidoreductase [Nocardiopsis sp. LDBS1602]MEC3894054.1 NAD(P)-dependent oxidoreductase [Nocardiopsis sp. LDBS1602]
MSTTANTDGHMAVCGLGAMGSGLAHRLLSAGLNVRVWNRTPTRTADLVKAGAVADPTPGQAASGASTVFVCVSDDEAAETVLTGPNGVLGSLERNAVVALACTLSPQTVQELVERVGVEHVVDVGMLGNAEHARKGELRLYVGGASDTVKGLSPVLELLAKQVLHVGGTGQGMRLKLVINLIMGVEMQVMAEATALGIASGLDRSLVLEAIAESGFASPVMAFKARRMQTRRYDSPDFRLDLMAKDLRLAQEQGSAAGLGLPVTSATLATHQEAVGAGFGAKDCAAIESHLVPAHGEA